jgi:hypothetical protein
VLQLAAEDRAIDLQIVDHQHLARPSGWRASTGAGVSWPAAEHDLDPEDAAAAASVGDADRPAHEVDQLAADGQAQAGAAKLDG